jgi:RHS repeat-associated protein
VGSGTALTELVYEYNDLGMPTKEYQEHEGVKDASTLYVGYNYDTTVVSGEYTKGLRPTSVRYPNARLVHLTYGTTGANGDALGRVESIKDDSGGSPGTSFADYSYLGSGTIVVEDYAQPDVKLNYDSGTAGTYAGFDRFGRVVDQLWYDYGASADRDRFTYGYDRASSRLYRENTVASAKDEYYTYDDVNRLATFDRGDLDAGKTAISGTPVKEEDWALDMTGNWTDFLQKTSGTTDLNQDRAHNPVNEITGITETVGTAWVDPVHDRAGNMTTMPKPSALNTALTCTWDAWNRLVEVKQGAVVMGRYEYDALGRRVKSHVDSQSPGSPNGVDAYVHYFYNSGWQELESRVSASENTGPESLQPTYQYVWSLRYIDAPVLRDKNTDADGLCDDERIYYLDDANFNITTLVNTGGDAIERYVYTPYGVLTVYDATWANIRSTSSYANAYTYTGRQLDAETGLYYYRARMYAPQLGRFASRDPIGYRAGSWNVIEFLRGRPVQSVDPIGLCTHSGHEIYDAGCVARCGRGIGAGYCEETCLYCRNVLHDWIDFEEASGSGWVANLPPCPCSIEIDPPPYFCGFFNEQKDLWHLPEGREGWTWDSAGNFGSRVVTWLWWGVWDFHPGSTRCIRSARVEKANGASQQCCYDAHGALITGGTGAGTPDRNDPGHIPSDVETYWCAWLMDGRHRGRHINIYKEFRPPNIGRGCSSNIVNGE